MYDLLVMVICLLFFVACLGFFGVFEQLGIYVPPLDQSYVRGRIDLSTGNLVSGNDLSVDDNNVAVLKNALECYKFSLELKTDFPVEVDVLYYDQTWKPLAITENITGDFYMNYVDMPENVKYIRLQVRRTDGQALENDEILLLSSKVQLSVTDKQEDWVSKIGSAFVDFFNGDTKKYDVWSLASETPVAS